MISPIVSICCITYNHAPYIRECLDGFLMQKCNFDFEILIHDDASTDGTQDIIKEYQQKYPDIIKPIFQTENQYSKGQRGINIKYNFPRAKGKYIALCEGDDCWTDPLKLQKQVDFLKNNQNYGLVCTAFFVKNEKNINKYPLHHSEIRPYDILHHNPIATLTTVFKKELLNLIIPHAKYIMGDYYLWIQISKFTKIKFLPEYTSVYRITPNSVSGRGDWEKMIAFDKQSIALTIESIRFFKLGIVKNKEILFERYSYLINKFESRAISKKITFFIRYIWYSRYISATDVKYFLTFFIK